MLDKSRADRFGWSPGELQLIPRQRVSITPRHLWFAINFVKPEQGQNNLRGLWLEGDYDGVRAGLYRAGLMDAMGKFIPPSKSRRRRLEKGQPRRPTATE